MCECKPPAKNPRAGAVEAVVPNYVDLEKAQNSRVIKFPGLISTSDREQIMSCFEAALAAGDPLVTNPQNKSHSNKQCVFLHGESTPEAGQLLRQHPRVIAKLVRAAVNAQIQGDWGTASGAPLESDSHALGQPLQGIEVQRLSIRVIELWEYQPGGGLVDDSHFDAGSIVTIVCQMCDSEDFTGGTFRTLEPDGTQKEYELECGDVICFVSHKYHNVTPVITGRRRSLVIELWEGGLDMWCR
eukprot:TRINITY_DN19406_c0_g1_i1.p1 TRINITY_DN19406_c0_g1~~TRINITY_DN19406_c0_g1_i1.p1  ORF type:complete len:243 (+),score=37.58 TRINITY_DN19406_c0_g1_i1:365-1093(+)